jgi:hypothetical protein
MSHRILSLLFVLTFGFILSACDGAGDSTYARMKFEKTDGMSTSTAFTDEDCADAGGFNKCATPAEYQLGIERAEMVQCGNSLIDLCTLNDSGSAFTESSSPNYFPDDGVVSVISGTTWDEDYVDFLDLTAGGIVLRVTYMQVRFPNTADVEPDYRRATVRLCLIDDCVTGAERGDILVRLNGLTEFKWYNASTFGLESTRPESPLVDADVAAGVDGSLGNFEDAYLAIPVSLDEVLTVEYGRQSTVTLKLNVEKTLHCSDSNDDGICSPSSAETFWFSFPSQYSASVQADDD